MSTANGVSSAKRSDSPRPSFWNAGSLDAIFNPKTVAVIGTNRQPAAMGHKTLSTVLSGEFGGSTFMVQSGQSSILGHQVYPSLSVVPAKVDLAVAVTSPEAAPEILAECVEQNVKGVILISSGFGASGADPAGAADGMRAVLRGTRTRVIGPNSLGVMNPLIGLNATPGLQMPIGGTVACLSESAILGRLVLDWSLKRIVGFSTFTTLGTMLDVSWANLIDHFGRDPNTRTIVIQISSIGDARSFISAAREVSLNKPIIVIKAGRDEASIRAVCWKSRSVPSDDDVLTAAFDRVGVLQVDTLEDLFYAADALSKQPRPRGPRLMVVSNADGPGLLAADSLIRSGVELAQPSVETREQLGSLCRRKIVWMMSWAMGARRSYVRAVEIAAKDPNCDGLLLLMVQWALSDSQRTAELLIELKIWRSRSSSATWEAQTLLSSKRRWSGHVSRHSSLPKQPREYSTTCGDTAMTCRGSTKLPCCMPTETGPHRNSHSALSTRLARPDEPLSRPPSQDKSWRNTEFRPWLMERLKQPRTAAIARSFDPESMRNLVRC